MKAVTVSVGFTAVITRGVNNLREWVTGSVDSRRPVAPDSRIGVVELEAESTKDCVYATRTPPGDPPVVANLMQQVLPADRLNPVGVIGGNAVKHHNVEVAPAKGAGCHVIPVCGWMVRVVAALRFAFYRVVYRYLAAGDHKGQVERRFIRGGVPTVVPKGARWPRRRYRSIALSMISNPIADREVDNPQPQRCLTSRWFQLPARTNLVPQGRCCTENTQNGQSKRNPR